MAVIFSFAILSIVLTLSQASVPLDVCNNQACGQEAERVNSQIDPSINPCDDFYRFACGKFLENTNNEEKLGKFDVLAEKAKKEILELYKEPVKFEDHRVVQSAKKLFQACMDIPKIEENGLKTIKNVLETVGGGWPLLEGDKWDETKFDWLQATYKLRALGYPYSIFLGLKIEDDPANKTRSLFQIETPLLGKLLSDQKETVNKIVVAFGKDQHDDKDIEKMVEFENNLLEVQTRIIIARRRDPEAPLPTHSVDKLQGIIGSINLLEFINTISGPAIQISSEDSVIVVANILRQWWGVIEKASKRTQANYLMWRVVREMVPYLTFELRNIVLPENELKAPRDVFCLNVTQDRFTPSPMNIIYSKKFFDKKKEVEAIALKIRDELLNGLDNSWLSGTNKENVANQLRNMVLVIGEPDDDSEKSLLDDVIVDMKEIVNEDFLNLLSQANRNHISLLYGRIKKSKLDKQMNAWYTTPSSYNIQFKTEDGVLSIPASQLEEPGFSQNRPNYFNYGSLGTEIGKQMSVSLLANNRDWTGLIAYTFLNQTECLIRDIENFQSLITFDQANEMHLNIVGAKLAHSAYQKWAEDNKMELKPLGSNYTTEQLFWISTVDCKYFPRIPPPAHLSGILLSEYDIKMSVDEDFPRTLVAAVMRNIPDVGKDFDCPVGSPMNPSDRCKIF